MQQQIGLIRKNALHSKTLPEERVDLRECVGRVRQGDAAAANELIVALYPVVIKVVRAYLPRRSSEEDMSQVVFMRIFSKLEQFSGKVPVEHWVSRIAVNTCLNEISKEKVRPELRWADLSEEQEEMLETLVRTPEDAHPAHGIANREIVGKLLAQLNPADRLVMTLMYLDDKTVAEIKAVTGWNTTLIKVRAFRARQKLKKHLKDLLSDCP